MCIMESKRGRVGEESNAVVSSVQVKIRTSEADTYVKVGWLPGVEKEEEEEEEEEREREPGSSSDTTEHIMEQKAHDSNTRLSSTKCKRRKSGYAKGAKERGRMASGRGLRVAEPQRKRRKERARQMEGK